MNILCHNKTFLVLDKMKYVCEFSENINLKQNSNDEMKYELSALKWNKKNTSNC